MYAWLKQPSVKISIHNENLVHQVSRDITISNRVVVLHRNVDPVCEIRSRSRWPGDLRDQWNVPIRLPRLQRRLLCAPGSLQHDCSRGLWTRRPIVGGAWIWSPLASRWPLFLHVEALLVFQLVYFTGILKISGQFVSWKKIFSFLF